MGKQLTHDTGPNGGRPCKRCGLRYSPETAYVPCFEEGDTFETWFKRQHPDVQKLIQGHAEDHVPPIPVDHQRYPIIWWYCAVEKNEVEKVSSKVLSEYQEPFSLRWGLRRELQQLIAESRRKQ